MESYGSFAPCNEVTPNDSAPCRRCSSVVERIIGNDEVECSIHSSGTIAFESP